MNKEFIYNLLILLENKITEKDSVKFGSLEKSHQESIIEFCDKFLEVFIENIPTYDDEMLQKLNTQMDF